MKNKRFFIIICAIGILLLIPFVSMQFTDELNWSAFDFLIAGVLLLLTGLLFEFVLRKVANFKVRLAILITLLVVFLLVWAELAVGIFNTPFSGN